MTSFFCLHFYDTIHLKIVAIDRNRQTNKQKKTSKEKERKKEVSG
jgi:hypothetical protein